MQLNALGFKLELVQMQVHSNVLAVGVRGNINGVIGT